MTFDELIRRFLAWSEQQRDLRAAISIGSRARASPPPDEWSDLDLVLVTTHPDRYLSESAWLHELGAPWLTFLEPTATRTHTERRVLFEGEIDVDVIPVSPSDLERLATRTRLDDADAIHRGFRVLLDKDGLTGTIERSAGLHQPAPPAAAFEALVHDFLYHAVWSAKKLRRGELWVAKGCVDGYMKRRLLTMMERRSQRQLPSLRHYGPCE